MRGTRCAIVGAGLMGRWHADAATKAGAEVAFIVDTDHSRAVGLARRLGLSSSAAINSLAPALEPQACAVVHVCTPVETHASLAREALIAGRHVLVEKPLAASESQTAELLDLADSRALLLVPVHQFLFQSGVKRALRALPSLGRPLHVDTVACSAGAQGRAGESDRIALDILPHALALTFRATGRVRDEVDWAVRRPAAGELRLLGQLGGVTVAITISMNGRPPRNDAAIICSAGTAHLDLFHGYAVIERGSTSRFYKVVRPFGLTLSTFAAAAVNLSRRAAGGSRAYPGLRELVRRFYASVERREPAPVSAEETLAVARARDRVAALLAGSDASPERRPALLA